MVVADEPVLVSEVEALGKAALAAGATAAILVRQAVDGTLSSCPIGSASWADGKGWRVSVTVPPRRLDNILHVSHGVWEGDYSNIHLFENLGKFWVYIYIAIQAGKLMDINQE
jgi:hypothetical protein